MCLGEDENTTQGKAGKSGEKERMKKTGFFSSRNVNSRFGFTGGAQHTCSFHH